MATQIMRDPLFKEFEAMQRRMDRLIGDIFRSTLSVPEEGLEKGAWTPAADVFEDSDHFLIKLDLPEMEMKEIELGIQDSLLTVKGERKLEKENQRENYHRIEREYGTFHRSFTLPSSVNQDKVSAEYNRGVLRIILPKKEETKPRRVMIEAR